jgi:drug/metabolite transporter (DMT)-like permease
MASTAAFYYTIHALGAGKATLFGNAYVLFAALIAAVFLRERLSLARTSWLVLAFLGIALLTSPGLAQGRPLGLGFSEIVALSGAITSGSAVVLIRRLTLRYSNATIYFSQCFWIGVTVIPFVLLRAGWPGWGGLVILILAGAAGGFGQIAMVQSYRYLEVARGASIQMALPVTASLGGFLLFGEVFTLLQVAGAALTVVGSWRVVAKEAHPAL